MCHCKRFEVSTPTKGNRNVVQRCIECGKEKEMPATIYSAIEWMEAESKNRPEFKSLVNYIYTYHTRWM